MSASNVTNVNSQSFNCSCRKPRKQSDVTSLISVLDSTLKLSDVSVDRESPDAEQERDEGDKEPLDVPFAGIDKCYSSY